MLFQKLTQLVRVFAFKAECRWFNSIISNNNNKQNILFKIYCGVVEVVSRQAHNLKVGGSSPSPATNGRTDSFYSKFDGKSDNYENKTNKFLLKLL
jgi:hypothetical protein